MSAMRLAILDDYQGAAHRFVDWSVVPDLEVVAFRDHVADERELVARLRGFDALMRIRERTPITASLLAQLPDLRLILATGMRNTNSLDLGAARRHGIVVTATEAYHQTTVEVVWLLILSLLRNATAELQSVRVGGWQVDVGRSLDGLRLGVVGLGNMGVPVARIADVFGMELLAWSPNMTQQRASEHGARAVPLEELMATSDVITIHLPLQPFSNGLISRELIALMKPDAVLVNTSRAQIVDEEALVDALRERRIAGAGLDVYNVEPLPHRHPLRELPNVVALPHVGFVTTSNYERFFIESLENLQGFLADGPVRVIDVDRPFLPHSQVARQRGL